ncbi:type II toxin-antitoxin system RelE/ParE family toxin [Acidiphilium cryptum]|uniref:Plasmid stabilization system n=1 Tax=Acidiphilium cryptum (strain JF-5) TaxID=349163 RepID=A5FUA4_ACICJ|nr:type II toxin-antitoxin system RelE/ParE family toxin [Acidiphilium cryptum]ABQ29186.1 plasmid stabilization system [Acidiphilium cryptum JF-5]
MPVIFTAEALDDLAHIRQHIGRENPHAATRVAVQLVAACDRLEYLPERGRTGLVSGTRELTVIWPYVIVYRISASSVEILRVWHGAQDRDGC